MGNHVTIHSMWIDKFGISTQYNTTQKNRRKKNVLLILAKTCMKLKIIILRKRNQTESACTLWFTLHKILEK